MDMDNSVVIRGRGEGRSIKVINGNRKTKFKKWINVKRKKDIIMIQSAVEEGCFHKTQLILVASCPLSLLLALLPLITSDSLTHS